MMLRGYAVLRFTHRDVVNRADRVVASIRFAQDWR
jgi:very-short-patch-repair endonuclease